MRTFVQQWKERFKDPQKMQDWFRYRFIGMSYTDGLLFKSMIYILLVSLGYIYLYPMLYMITNSLMSVSDIIDSSIRWIPSRLNWENYQLVWQAIDYPMALRDAIFLAGVPAFFATLSSAIIGYGFARFEFPLKKLWMVLMIMTFIIPPQITMMPTFRLYAQYGLLGSIQTFIFPAILGHGFNGAIYILIFYSFFKMIPKSLEESAQLDGASAWSVFVRISLPLTIPAIIIVFLFSFVWYYNETFLSGLFLRGSDWLTLPLRVEQFFINYTSLYPEGSQARELMQVAKLAGNILAILPLLVLYFFTQRYFVESVDRSGIAGE